MFNKHGVANVTSNDELKELLVKLTSKVDKIEESTSITAKKCIKNENDIAELKRKNIVLTKRVSGLEKQVASLQSAVRRRNLVLYGIPDNIEMNSDLLKSVSEIFQEAGVKPENVEEARRIGREKGKRPVRVSLISLRDKKAIFDNYGTLKVNHGITIANDENKEKRGKYRELKKLHAEFENHNIVSTINKLKLQVGRKQFSITEAQKYLASVLNPSNPSSKNQDSDQEGQGSDDSSFSKDSKKRPRDHSDESPGISS